MRALPIKYPCRESFAEMSESHDGARLCARCDERVYDLSSMTEEQATALLASGAPMCVRFSATRDGNIRFRVALVAAAVTIAASGAAMAAATEPSPVPATMVPPDAGPDVVDWMGRK